MSLISVVLAQACLHSFVFLQVCPWNITCNDAILIFFFLEWQCRSYFIFHGLDINKPQSVFKFLPFLSFTESYIYQVFAEVYASQFLLMVFIFHWTNSIFLVAVRCVKWKQFAFSPIQQLFFNSKILTFDFVFSVVYGMENHLCWIWST